MAGPPHIPLATSRRRPAPTGDEEASNTLRLGEMTDVQTLSVAEANELLKFIEDKRKREGLEINNKDIYVKSRDYVNLFARFKDRETVEQVERESLAIPGVTKFERAQLATLCCDTAEEARTLIPSLEGKISDDDLQTALDNISKLRDFT